MTQPLTISELDHAAAEWIEQEAQRTGLTVDEIARQLLYRGLETERQRAQHERHHDLDALAGTWTAKDAEAFRQAISDLAQVDATLWQ